MTVRWSFRWQGKSFTPRADFYNLTNESAVMA
jgi:hypothetical protein